MHDPAQLRTTAEQDTALHAALQQDFAAQTGTDGDVLDALWWAAHPLQLTPTGVPDPAGQLAPLQAAVFSRSAAAEPQVERTEDGLTLRATASEHRLRQLERDLRLRAQAVHTLLARTTPTEMTDASVLPVVPQPSDTPLGTHHRLRVPWRALLISVGVVAGVLGTLSIHALQQAVAPTTADGASMSRQTPAPTTTSPDPTDAEIRAITDIFDDRADPGDADLADLGPAYEVVRTLGIPPRETYGVFLAKRGTDQYCLVLQEVDLTASSTCAKANDIAQDGLQLQAVVLDTFRFEENSPLELLDLTVNWQADGSVATSSSRHTKDISAFAR